MKVTSFLLIIFFLFGCIVDKGKVSVDIKRKSQTPVTDTNSIVHVSSVKIIENQLVVTGKNLNTIENLKIDGNAFSEKFTIESKSANQIIANSIRHFSFDVSKVFNLILSSAEASATFQIDFNLCNATLYGKGFDCLGVTSIQDKDVLTYDSSANAWVPKPLNDFSYQGTLDASGVMPSAGSAGEYYIITVAGNGFSVGDWAVSNGTSFDQINNSTSVTKVFGRLGDILPVEGDYNLGQLGDVTLPVLTGADAGKILKYNGTQWVLGDDLSGGGAGSVVTSSIANSAVTDAKIDSISASKITGTINSSQILDGTIVNADISNTAAIALSKIDIPDASIPAAKISGLPSATVVLASSIVDGDTTHAPSGEAVYEALLGKLGLGGGTLTTGTINGVPTPVAPSDIVNKDYVDDQDALALLKAGDTMSGLLSLDANLRMKGAANYVTLRAHATTAAYNFVFPQNGGTSGYVLSTDGSGNTSWVSASDSSVQTFAKTTLPTCGVGEVLKSNGTALSCVTDASGGGAFTGANSRAVATGTGGALEVSTTTSTELGYLSGVTGPIQTQIDSLEEFTEGKVLGSILTSLNTLQTGPITASDSVLDAFGKLQYQVTDLKGNGQWVKTSNDIAYSAGNVSVDNKFRLKDSATNYVEIKAPATVTSTYVLTLPANDGDANQVLRTDGSGVLSWVDVADSDVKTFAKNNLPTCATGEVLKSNGTTLTCVTDAAGAAAFSGAVSRAVATSIGGALEVSTTTSTELGYVSGVTGPIQTQINGKEGTLAAGTTAQYYRGDKSWQTLDSSAVVEGSRLYFTEDRVRATPLTGVTSATGTIVPSDTILDAFGKLINTQADYVSKSANTTITGTLTINSIVGALTVPSPINPDDAVNKSYVDTEFSAKGVGGMSIAPSSIILMRSCPSGWTNRGVSAATGPASAFCGDVVCQACESPATLSLLPSSSTILMDTCPSGWTGKSTVLAAQGAGLDFFYTSCESPAVPVTIPPSSRVIMGPTCPTGWLDLGLISAGQLAASTSLGASRVCQVPGPSAYGRVLFGSDADAAGTGASVTIRSGKGGNTGGLSGTVDISTPVAYEANGSAITISAGAGATASSTARAGGSVSISAGAGASNGNGGNVTISAGAKNGTGINGNILFPVGNVGIGYTPWNDFGVYRANASVVADFISDNTSTTTARYPAMRVLNYGGAPATGSVGNPSFALINMRGTSSVSAPMRAGEPLGAFVFNGGSDAAGGYKEGAAIWASATENFSSTTAGSNLTFYTTANGTVSSLPKMLIDQNGNVGINNNNPGEKLEVNGNIRLKGTGKIIFTDGTSMQDYFGWNVTLIDHAGGQAFRVLADNDTTTSPIISAKSNHRVGINTDAPASTLSVNGGTSLGSYHATAAPTDGLIVSGSVGIGTATPGTYALSVYRAANATFNMESGGDGNAIYNRYAGKKNNGVAQVWGTALNLSLGNGEYEIYDFTNSASRLLVDTTGKVGIGTTTPGYMLHVNGQVAGVGAYVNASDIRYKKDIAPIQSSLDRLTSLEGVYYNWKQDEFPDMNFGKTREMGVIAQKVEKIFPEAVSKDEKGFRSVAYSMLIAPIIESIKEIKNWLIGHDKAIEQNQRKIASLESEVRKQKEENAAMKSWICSKDPKAPICK